MLLTDFIPMRAADGTKTNLTDFIFSKFPQKKEQIKTDAPWKPICKARRRLLRVNRKVHEQQILIIVEEEEEELPSMRIQNKCSNVSVLFQ